jgi:hypothetical protein
VTIFRLGEYAKQGTNMKKAAGEATYIIGMPSAQIEAF